MLYLFNQGRTIFFPDSTQKASQALVLLRALVDDPICPRETSRNVESAHAAAASDCSFLEQQRHSGTAHHVTPAYVGKAFLSSLSFHLHSALAAPPISMFILSAKLHGRQRWRASSRDTGRDRSARA